MYTFTRVRDKSPGRAWFIDDRLATLTCRVQSRSYNNIIYRSFLVRIDRDVVLKTKDFRQESSETTFCRFEKTHSPVVGTTITVHRNGLWSYSHGQFFFGRKICISFLRSYSRIVSGPFCFYHVCRVCIFTDRFVSRAEYARDSVVCTNRRVVSSRYSLTAVELSRTAGIHTLDVVYFRFRFRSFYIPAYWYHAEVDCDTCVM